MPRNIHAAIISWQGKHSQARRIADAIKGVVDLRLSVVASHPEPGMVTAPGDWHFVPNSHFFGPKCALALAATKPNEILLLIHADTDFNDWQRLVARCVTAFEAVPNLAVWAPDFTWTPYPLPVARVPGGRVRGDDGMLVPVLHTDGIVVAFAPAAQDRLRALDCASNNLGWGIDWAAIGWAYSHGYLVLRDTAICVTHQRSRSYGPAEAVSQMQQFFNGLGEVDRIQIALLNACLLRQKDQQRSRLRRAWDAVCGKSDQPFI